MWRCDIFEIEVTSSCPPITGRSNHNHRTFRQRQRSNVPTWHTCGIKWRTLYSAYCQLPLILLSFTEDRYHLYTYLAYLTSRSDALSHALSKISLKYKFTFHSMCAYDCIKQRNSAVINSLNHRPQISNNTEELWYSRHTCVCVIS